MRTELNEEAECRRIILLRGRKPEVLLAIEGSPRRSLQEILIPRWQRVAEHLTAALRDTCGIDAVSLSSFEYRLSGSSSERIRYEILEPCGPEANAPREKEWVSVDALVESGFQDPCDFQAVHQAAAQCMANRENTISGPFGSLGWFPAHRQWVEEKIAPHGLHLNGKFRQLNACSTFSLIRFETDGPAVWFKAVGAPNLQEYPITAALARSFPRFLPQIVATRPEWNGWLALEAAGSLLSECSTPASWESAARDLAELQISSLGGSARLLEPGARDLRASTLADCVETFFSTMGVLMERQAKTPPAPLTHAELRAISTRVRDALAVLEETGIPATLGHLDLNPGNIVCSQASCVFLDWAEAFVGHPFLSFEYLLEHFRRAFGLDHSQEPQLVARYTSTWRRFASESDIRRALDVAPLVALFAYATGTYLWKNSQKLEAPRTAGYLRSLTRRMQRESRVLVERSVRCPS